jgi:hypothetical protein
MQAAGSTECCVSKQLYRQLLAKWQLEERPQKTVEPMAALGSCLLVAAVGSIALEAVAAASCVTQAVKLAELWMPVQLYMSSSGWTNPSSAGGPTLLYLVSRHVGCVLQLQL